MSLMNRTPEAEAQRKVNQSKTWYSRLVEKNRRQEEEYREKITRQEQALAEVRERTHALNVRIDEDIADK